MADSCTLGQVMHHVIDHVRKGFSGDGYPQVLHMGKIGLGTLAWVVSLLENDFLLRPMDSTPSGNVSLQRPNLGRSIAAWMSLAEQRKQRGPL